jgi:hypothetical protein
VLQELQAIVPHSPKLPVQPIIVAGQKEPGMFDSLEAYPWCLKVYPYDNPAQLLAEVGDRVIPPKAALGPLKTARRATSLRGAQRSGASPGIWPGLGSIRAMASRTAAASGRSLPPG